MAKPNIRSFRFSDEVAGIIAAFDGLTLNEKFENLVLHCFWEREKVEKDLARLRSQHRDLISRCDEKRKELFSLDSLLAEKKQLIGSISRLSLQMVDFNEKLERVTQDGAAAAADR